MEANSHLLSQVDQALRDVWASYRKRHVSSQLLAAMEYSLFSGGKRMRPVLVKLAAQAASPQLSEYELNRLALPAMAAVEWVHTYSLIHDDLPSMDDDKERRGKPTCHIVFGEALAILAGDALLSDAFWQLSLAPRQAARQCAELAGAIGSFGMVGGQALDIAGSKNTLRHINELKTAKLFSASFALGALSANANHTLVDNFRKLGHLFGLAFQYLDDVDDFGAEGVKDGLTLDALNSRAGEMAEQALMMAERYSLKRAGLYGFMELFFAGLHVSPKAMT